MIGDEGCLLTSLHRAMHSAATEKDAATADIALEVSGLTRRGTKVDASAIVLADVSFQLRRGEILGLAGLVGAGRTEIVRAIFGADDWDSGRVYVDGRQADIRSPREAIRCGIGFVPEDRKEQGLILNQAVRLNLTLPSLASPTGFVN
jgi:ABC-type sugar transport system ATPase subunit